MNAPAVEATARVQDLRQRLPSPARGPFEIPTFGFMRRFYDEAVRLRAAPFRGVRGLEPSPDGLFSLEPTNVSTAPVLAAARKLLDSMSYEQRTACVFGIESDNWRSWCNFHLFLFRHGLCLADMSEAQRGLVHDLMRESMSQRGYETARDVIRINEHMAELSGRVDEFGETFFWLSFFGNPSADEPWGWQIDGQHLAINCFVLGDHLVVSPTFMGSEPVQADSGKYKGTRVFRAEEALGLDLVRALTPAQRDKAVLGNDLPFDVFAHSFNDNAVIAYQGIPATALDGAQRDKLAELLAFYVGRDRPGHAEYRLGRVMARLDQTHFAWIGKWGDADPFYYRVHNPLILIEFDHQPGVMFANDQPSRRHIHTVVRTPNGNDYGKALLRQYYERVRRAPLDAAGVPDMKDTVARFGSPTIV